MLIKNIELKNFLGLRKISDKNNIVNLQFSAKLHNITLIKGENGYGKSVILENMTPYSQMIKRDIKTSIEYPAYKKIELIFNKETYKCEIFWDDEKSTKGYIYKNGVKLPETEKGNITEYNYQINKIFGDYEKFKNSVFLKQGANEIVDAKPTERLNIINKFMPSLFQYDIGKKYADEKIKDYQKDLETIKNQLKSIEELKFKYERNKEEEKKYSEDILNKNEEDLKKYTDLKNNYVTLNNNLKFHNDTIIEKENFLKTTILKENLEKELKDLENALIKIDEDNFISLKETINFIDFYLNKIKKIEEDLIVSYSDKDIELINKDLINLKEEEKEYIKQKEYVKNLDEKINAKNKEIKSININKDLDSELEKLEKKSKTLIVNEDKLSLLESFIEDMKLFSSLTKNLVNKNFELKIEDTKLKIDNINKDLDNSKTIEKDLEYKEKIFNDLNENVAKIKIKIKEVKYSLEDKKSIELEIKELSKKIYSLEDKEKILLNIENKSLCPTCNQELTTDYIDNIKKEVETLKSNKDELIKLEKKLELANEDIQIRKNNETYNKELDKMNSELKELKEDINKLTKNFKLINNRKSLKEELDNTELYLKELSVLLEALESIKKYEDILIDFDYKDYNVLYNRYKSIFELKREELSKEKSKEKELIDIKNQISLLKKDIETNNKNIDLKNKLIEEVKLLEKEFKSIVLLKNNEDKIKLLEKEINRMKNSNINFELLKEILNNKLIKNLNISEGDTYNKLLEHFVLIQTNTQLDIEKITKQKNQNEITNKAIKDKEREINENNILKNSIEKYKLDIEKSSFKIQEINKELSLFSKEDIEKFFEEYEVFRKDYQSFLIDKQDLERQYQNFLDLENKKIALEENIFLWKRLKQYNIKIKKSIISETFAEITTTANEILKNEGTIGNLRLEINQINDRKFEIKAKDIKNNLEVNDISNLSGAEAMAVSKAISFSLSKNTDFKILWLDESDGALSKKNKTMFVEMLKKLFTTIDIEEIFVISHQDEVEKVVDDIIDLNKLVK